MGCGCNKIRYYSQTSPLMFGEDDGNPPRNMRATVTLMGLRVGSEFWAAGSGLSPLVDAGWLVAI